MYVTVLMQHALAYLWRAVVLPGEEVLAEVDADGEVLVARVNLGLEALVVVHQQLDAAHVTRSLLRLHLQYHVAHPQRQVAHHAEKPATKQPTGVLVRTRQLANGKLH